jgi:hypothetical protein
MHRHAEVGVPASHRKADVIAVSVPGRDTEHPQSLAVVNPKLDRYSSYARKGLTGRVLYRRSQTGRRYSAHLISAGDAQIRKAFSFG